MPRRTPRRPPLLVVSALWAQSPAWCRRTPCRKTCPSTPSRSAWRPGRQPRTTHLPRPAWPSAASSSSTRSCRATGPSRPRCHRPDHGFASPDARPVGVAGRQGHRRAPSLLNRAYGTAFFWDGRAAGLEEQALQPIENPDEMASSVAEAVSRLKADEKYQKETYSSLWWGGGGGGGGRGGGGGGGGTAKPALRDSAARPSRRTGIHRPG